MTKYHINSKGHKEVCYATVRKCRFQEVPSSPATTARVEDKESFLKALNATNTATPIVPRSLHHEPNKSFSSYAASEDGGIFTHDEDDSDYYGKVISQTILSVNVPAALTELHYLNSPQELDADYLKAAEKAGLGDPDSYIVDRSPGYYDSDDIESYVELKPEVHAELLKAYYKLYDANDAAGVLEYARGKGFDTTGLTPVEALKAQLKTENGGKEHSRVDAATEVSLGHLSIESIRIPATKHYEEVEPAPLAPAHKGATRIAGVVTRDGNGNYTLVDGYHRMKTLKKSNRKYANYFILS